MVRKKHKRKSPKHATASQRSAGFVPDPAAKIWADARYSDKLPKAVTRLMAARRTADSEADWSKMVGELSVPDIIEIAAILKGKRGHPADLPKRQEWIMRLAERIFRGLSYRPLATQFRPDLPANTAYLRLKSFRNKHKPAIDAAVLKLKNKHVTS